MEPETQATEMDARVEREGPSVVDLNQATAEELETLAGIGPSLARRIVAYREEQGGFDSPEELTAIPGIGRAAYEKLADRLTVVPPEVVPPSAEEAPLEKVPEAALPSPEVPAVPEAPPPETSEAVLEGEFISPAEEIPGTEEAPAPPHVETAAPPPSSAPPPKLFRRDTLSWIGAALVGGLLGMVLTLIVLYGINRALDLSIGDKFGRFDRLLSGLNQRLDRVVAERLLQLLLEIG